MPDKEFCEVNGSTLVAFMASEPEVVSMNYFMHSATLCLLCSACEVASCCEYTSSTA